MINFKNSLIFFVSLVAVFFTACQSESAVEIHSTKETISKTAPLTTYIERVVMQKTSQDNIIDHSNCFMINFPYVVTVNDVQIAINSANDYQLVQNNINANSNDSDIVFIHFPITVTLNNYSKKNIADQTAYANLIAECKTDSEDFGKINCINIVFPITINSYDSNNQIASTTSVTDNQSFYNFFKNLESNKFIAISYPISIINSNGQNTIITSNSQFEDVIKSAVDNCSENINHSIDFMQTITSSSWKISYYYKDNDQTLIYNGYDFVFKTNYTVVATKSGIAYNGTWSTKVDNGVREFEIKIESDPLKKLDEGWKELEFNNSQLRFRDGDVNNETDYLYFAKN